MVLSFPPSQLFAVLHATRLVHSTLIQYVPSADPRRIRTKDEAPHLPTTTAFPNRTVFPASESAFPFLLYCSDLETLRDWVGVQSLLSPWLCPFPFEGDPNFKEVFGCLILETALYPTVCLQTLGHHVRELNATAKLRKKP